MALSGVVLEANVVAAIDEVAAMEPLLRLSAGVAGRTARADAAAAARSWHAALTQRYMPLPRVAVVQVWCPPPARNDIYCSDHAVLAQL